MAYRQPKRPVWTASSDTLGRMIRMEVNLSGKTQAEIAEGAGISAKHLNRFMNGFQGLSLEVVDAILWVLGKQLVLGVRYVTEE